MAIIPWSRRDRNELSRLDREMGNIFDRFFTSLGEPFFEYRAWPAIDVAEKQDTIMVRAEVPGCKPEDIDVSVYGDTLTISGEKKDSQEEKREGFYHVESSYGSFRREVQLPTDVDEQKIDAEYKDGVLSIMLPKAQKSKAVKVKVKGQ
jgi:HSP20 family protein